MFTEPPDAPHADHALRDAQPIQAISIAEERTVEPRSLPLPKTYQNPAPALIALPPALAHCAANPAGLESPAMAALRVRGGSQPPGPGEAGALLGGAAGGSCGLGTPMWPLPAAVPGGNAGSGLGFPAALQTLPEGLQGGGMDQQGMPAAFATWEHAAALGALSGGTLAAPGTPGAQVYAGNGAGVAGTLAGYPAGFQGAPAGMDMAGLCGALLQQAPAQALQGAKLLGAQGPPAGCSLGMGACLPQHACGAAAAAGMPLSQASRSLGPLSAGAALGHSAQDAAAAALSAAGLVQGPGPCQGLGPSQQPSPGQDAALARSIRLQDVAAAPNPAGFLQGPGPCQGLGPGQDALLARSIRLYGKSRSLPASLPARGGPNIWGPPASLPGALSASAGSSLAGSPLARVAAGAGAAAGAFAHTFCFADCKCLAGLPGETASLLANSAVCFACKSAWRARWYGATLIIFCHTMYDVYSRWASFAEVHTPASTMPLPGLEPVRVLCWIICYSS